MAGSPLRRPTPLGAVSPDLPRPGGRPAGLVVAPDRATVGCGKEPVEITDAIPSIAALIDAIEAEAPKVTPRAHRVRVHAEDPRRLGDGEGRINWPWSDRQHVRDLQEM